jgi:hypothetical protein
MAVHLYWLHRFGWDEAKAEVARMGLEPAALDFRA